MKLEARLQEMASSEKGPDALQPGLEAAQRNLESYQALQEQHGFSDTDMELWADKENPYRIAKLSRNNTLRLSEMAEKIKEGEAEQDTEVSGAESASLEQQQTLAIQKAGSFDELFNALDSVGTIQGSGKVYEPAYIKNMIESVRQHPESISLNEITRSLGIRQKVSDLLKLDELRESL